MDADLVGEKLGKYEITARIASSVLAEVYRAHSPSLGREVAIKVYRAPLASDPTLTKRLREEAWRAASLHHPHIAPIYDCDVATVAGQPLLYVVSEFAEGATLKERLAALKASGQTMSLSEVMVLLQAIAAALDYAHSRGVVHGGLKPTNVLFTAGGDRMLADFGMARAVATAVQALPADPAGAPAYMAPEQIRGEPIDGRADIYALGVLLYELCTNTLPFTADTATGVLMRHLSEPPPPPSRANPALPPSVEQVILKALSKSPADRYQTAGEMVAALEGAIAGRVSPAPVPPTESRAPATAIRPGRLPTRMAALLSPFLAEEEALISGRTAGEKPERGGIRNLLIQILAIFTAVLALIERFLKAIDILRNPLVGLIVMGGAVALMVISAGYVLARPQLYKRWQRQLAAIGLILTVLAALGWGGWAIYDMKRPPKGLIVLIADFEQAPGARTVNYARRIETGLNEALSRLNVEGVYVERAYEVYTEEDARARAAARKAAVVIYGWYDDAGVSPRFELVRAPQQYLPLLRQASVALADLDKLEVRVDRELAEMNYIAATAIGLAYYADGQNDRALPFFDLALRFAPEETRLMGTEAVYFYKGSAHFYLHQFPQALAALQEAVRINPDLYEAHRNLAVAYSANCDYDAALREMDESLRLKPDSGDAYYLRGVLLMSRGRWDEAVAALTRAAELSPDDLAVYVALGQAREEIGQAEEAAAAFAKAAALSEASLKEKESAGDPQVIAARADLLRSQGRFEEAVAEHQRAIEIGEKRRLRPDRLAWLYRSLGRTYWDMERWAEMAEAYNRAIALSPGLYSDYAALAAAYRGIGQPDQAVAAYQQALALLPCDALTHNLLASLYRELGRTDEALQEYRLAVQYDPDDFTAWDAIGMILEERGETEGAKDAYQKAVAAAERYLERNPHDATTASFLGLMYLLLGDTRRAVSTLQNAVALQPSADNHYALGNAYYAAHEYENALAEYQAALAVDPQHFASAVRLGDTCERLNRTDEAIAAYRRALTLKEDADVHAYLGMLLERVGRTNEAEAEYRASLRVKDNVLAHLGLAQLYRRTGKIDQAVAEYQAALRLQDDPHGRFALAQLYEARGRLEDAASQYQAAIPLFGPEGPYRDNGRVALARVLLRLCRSDEALVALQPSLEGGPGASVDVLSALAAIYEAQGRTSEASEIYARLLRENPDLPIVHYLAGGFAYRQNRLDEAVREMEQATKLAPPFSLAWSSLGYFYELQRNFSAAQAAHRTALELLPSNVSALLGLGEMALRQGHIGDALSYFQEALGQQPEYASIVPDETQATLVAIHLDLALAYERLGRSAEANQELATVRQLAEAAVAALPSHPRARFQLAMAYWLTGENEQAEAAFAEAVRCDASLAGERVRVEQRIRLLRGR